MSAPQPYQDFTAFKVDYPAAGVMRLWLDTGFENNLITHENHHEFGEVWLSVAREKDVKAVLLRGVNGVFCGGGDMTFIPPMVHSHERRSAVLHDIRSLVLNLIACPKPVVAAIDGLCSGGGLALGMMADISVVSPSTTLLDAHVVAGITCGDHATFAWPLKMGMAKASYHLLSATPLSGQEAERCGLASVCVDDAELHQHALEIAERIASLPAEGVVSTKASLTAWYRLAQPIFEQSAAMEAFTFAGDVPRALADDMAQSKTESPG